MLLTFTLQMTYSSQLLIFILPFRSTRSIFASSRQDINRQIKAAKEDFGEAGMEFFFRHATTRLGLQDDLQQFRPFAKPVVFLAGGRLPRAKEGDGHCQTVVLTQYLGKPIAFIKDSLGLNAATVRTQLFPLFKALGVNRVLLFGATLYEHLARKYSECLKEGIENVAAVLDNHPHGRFWEPMNDGQVGVKNCRLYCVAEKDTIENWTKKTLFEAKCTPRKRKLKTLSNDGKKTRVYSCLN